jgi:hypothetical protein
MAVPPEPLPATMLATLELMRLRAAVLVRDGAEDEAVAILAAGLVTAHRIGAIQGFLDDRVFLAHRHCGTRRADPGCPCPMTTTSHCVRWEVRPTSNR